MKNPESIVGKQIILKPTQGAYQKDKQGVIISESSKRFVVCCGTEEITFCKVSGAPVFNIDKHFPCYVAELTADLK